MRLMALRVRNFKGIRDRSIEFRPQGITLIQGPNEVGKTSFVSAFTILIEFQDSSRHRDVEAIKPQGQDLATEIEAHFSLGGKTFHYAKRYHRDRQTTLTMQSHSDSLKLSGRQAHDYMRNFIETHTDWDLWKAIQIVQGAGVDEAAAVALGEFVSLKEALDRVAGGNQRASDDSLLQRVEREFERYYTPTGMGRAAVWTAPKQRVEALKTRVNELAEEIMNVERIQDRLVHLGREIDNLSRQWSDAQELYQKIQVDMRTLQTLESSHREILAQYARSQEQLSGLERQQSEREKLVQEEALLIESIEQLESQRIIREAAKSQADQDLIQKRQVFLSWDARSLESRQAFERLNEDAAIFVSHAELDTLKSHLARIDQLQREGEIWAKARRRIQVSKEGISAIRKQAAVFNAAKAVLEVATPQVSIKALSAIPLTINGETELMAASNERTFSVSEPLSVKVADVLDMSLLPGASVSTMHATLEKERARLRKLLNQFGVSSLTEAEDAWNQKTALDAKLERLTAELEEALSGEDSAKLKRRFDELTARVDEYRLRRGTDYVFLTSPDEAQRQADCARKTMTETDENLRNAVRELELATVSTEASKQELESITRDLMNSRDELLGVQHNLEQLRQEIGDEDLATKATNVRQSLESIKAEEDALNRRLALIDPDQMRLRDSQKRQEIDRLQTQLSDYTHERAEIQGRLQALGGLGLSEELDEATGLLDKGLYDLKVLEQRARAAKILYDIVTTCRDAEQRRYREPLRREIVRLGAVVFGQGFDVALDDSLQVISRTLDGIKIPVQALSTGAKEQLALVIRLAVASLVSPTEGVPIILDDTLGHTDDARLDLMAAVLNLVAKKAQIILITSAATRYTKIGDAHIVDWWSDSTRQVSSG